MMPTDPNQAHADLLASDLTALLKAEALAAGVQLRDDVVKTQQNLSASLQRLAKSVGQPGAEEARTAEVGTLALEEAQIAISEGDTTDNRIIAILDTGLAIGSRALSLALGVPPVAPAAGA